MQYFGKRFLNPLLNRWVSPDPLAVHAPGKADLNVYAYVSGQVLKATDPLGLTPDNAVDIEQALHDQTGGRFGADHPNPAAATPAPTAPAPQGGTGGTTGEPSATQRFGGTRGTGSLGPDTGDPAGGMEVAVAAMSVVPLMGEGADFAGLANSDASFGDRTLCAVSLCLSLVTGGLSPNYGALERAADGMAGGRQLTLYHGTSAERAASIEASGIDLARGSPRADFGQGFYLTPDATQARDWAAKRFGEQGVVMQYTVDLEKLGSLRTFDAGESALETLVEFHRRSIGPSPAHGFDAVAGPMLKNPRSFASGAEPLWSGTQFSVHTEQGVQSLTYTGRF